MKPEKGGCGAKGLLFELGVELAANDKRNNPAT
jgi:hypothetical protein